MPAPDRALDEPGFDLGDGVDQADVGGDVDDLQLRGRQHHRHLLGSGEVGEQFGVAGVDVAAAVQGRLVQRGGADRLDLPAHRQLAGDPDVVVGRVARRRGTTRPTAGPRAAGRGRSTLMRPGSNTASATPCTGTIFASTPRTSAACRSRAASPTTTEREVSTTLGCRSAGDDDLRADAGPVAHGHGDRGIRAAAHGKAFRASGWEEVGVQRAHDPEQAVRAAEAAGAGDDVAAVGGLGADGAVLDLRDVAQGRDVQGVEDVAGGFPAGEDEVGVTDSVGDCSSQGAGQVAAVGAAGEADDGEGVAGDRMGEVVDGSAQDVGAGQVDRLRPRLHEQLGLVLRRGFRGADDHDEVVGRAGLRRAEVAVRREGPGHRRDQPGRADERAPGRRGDDAVEVVVGLGVADDDRVRAGCARSGR